MKKALFVFVLLVFALNIYAQIPAAKQTKLGLYVTAKEAFEKYQQDKKHVNVLDVRTPAEYIYVGHATMAANIPYEFLAGVGADGTPIMRTNNKFIKEVRARFAPTETILLMCRSGHRAAKAINMLSYAGYKHVYQVVDGFEGDKLNAPGNPNDGKRVVNGWKNAGLPWTYKLDANLIYKE